MNVSRFASPEQPPVLVVVTHWNDETTTAECLKHLHQSDYTNYRTVVVDSGSSDGSGARLKNRFLWIDLIRLEENRGHTFAANTGAALIKKYSPSYLLFLDNDAYLEKDCLAHLIHECEKDGSVGMACPLILSGKKPGMVWYAGGKISIFGNARHLSMGKAFSSDSIISKKVQYATSCVLLLRASVMERVGLFDETLSGYSEDLDLSIRMRKAGYTILFVSSARALHGESSNVIKIAGKPFRDYYTMRNRLYVIKKHGTLFQRSVGLFATIFWYGMLHAIVFSLLGKFNRASATLRGVSDFFSNSMGWQEL